MLAREAKRDMDRGHVPDDDNGDYGYTEYPTEEYAELFAFMSLIHPNQTARADFGRRARKLLMYAINEAAKGRKQDTPFRDPDFSVSDRSRWDGESFALTVDWAYRYFTAADKRTIRKVFLRWAGEQYRFYPMTSLEGARPRPQGESNNPVLLANIVNVRYALNNYYLAHARNLGLMALALDPADDPGGKLRSQIEQVKGQWLFVIDHALRTQADGGFSPEGFEYGPEGVGRIAQLLVALRTAGVDTESRIDANPFWQATIPAFLHSLPPLPTREPDSERDQIWQAASFGDEQDYRVGEPITLFGPLALEAAERGDQKTHDAIRWIQTNVPEGGKQELLERAGSSTDQRFEAIWYFLVFDPTRGEPADPRPALGNRYFAPALNRTLARTCWCADGRVFAHKLSYNTIDHQIADGNDFGFHRKGEWLTKNRTGYNSQFTDYTNSVTIENERPEHHERDDLRWDIWKRGEQYILNPVGDPTLVARSFGDGFVALTGDATDLYNSDYEGVHGVTHASRSIVWLEPDHIVVYDRATTKAPGFKRSWVQLPSRASIDGSRATARTRKGQQLFVTSLLPQGARITSPRSERNVGEPANGDPMRFRLRVAAAGDPRDTRFLHVLQGADRGASPDAATRLRSSAGAAYDGAAVAGTAVLFPVDLDRAGPTTVPVPAGVQRVLVTGLQPDAAYTATYADGAVTVAAGGDVRTDGGGVLVVNAS